MSKLATRFLLVLTIVGTTVAAAGAAWAADPVYYDWRGRAIKGYDPVAYFTTGRPAPGSPDFRTEWQGATWYFANADHLRLFQKSPELYAPQYGGYCAYAVSQGYTAKIDPQAWKIVDGKLYLNYSKSIRSRWEANQAEYIVAADRNWPGVLQ